MGYRLAIASALGLAALTVSADAQTVQVVPSCTGVVAQSGGGGRLYTDQTGKLCVAASTGGTSAPPPSSAIGVQRTANIGTTGALVSASDATNRRTVTNTSAIACEIVPASGGAYGTGYPLPPNGFFTFDAAGRTTAALYVACASAGGAVAVLSY